MLGRAVLLVGLSASASAWSQAAPPGSPITPSFTAASGARMTGFAIRVADGRCIARMKFRSRDGRTGDAEWTFTAVSGAGNVRCTRGQWRELIPNGNSGSMNNDIVIAGGKPYWVGR